MLFKNITVIDESYSALPDAYLLIEGKTIKYIGCIAPQGYTGPVYDGVGKVAMPGFFNMHCHVPMSLIRGYGEGLPLHRWLNERMFPFEALMQGTDYYWGSLLGIAEMLASGAVSFTDMYMAMPELCRAVQDSGIKANLSHGTSLGGDIGKIMDFADNNGHTGAEYLHEYMKNTPDDRIVGEVAIHAEYTSNEHLDRQVAEYAKAHGMRIHLHLSETKKEHDEAIERRGMTAAQWFEGLGVFDVPVTAAHCVWVSDSDIDILARHGVTAVHCPSSNLKLGSGIAPVKAMLERGVRVCIGTDGAASNNNLNMLEEVNLAALLQRGRNCDPMLLGGKELLTLACKNGALAQSRMDCGALAVGNRADIVVYDLDSQFTQPVFDPLSNVLFAANAGNVALTMVDGAVLYEGGEFKTIDIERVKFEAGRIAREKLAALHG